MIKVFDIFYYQTAGDTKIITNEKPRIVCVELHRSVLDNLTAAMKLTTRTSREEEFYRAEAGDGIVAIIESA